MNSKLFMYTDEDLFGSRSNDSVVDTKKLRNILNFRLILPYIMRNLIFFNQN